MIQLSLAAGSLMVSQNRKPNQNKDSAPRKPGDGSDARHPPTDPLRLDALMLGCVYAYDLTSRFTPLHHYPHDIFISHCKKLFRPHPPPTN